MTKSDFEARNALGVVIRTFGDATTGRRWVKDHAPEHNGLRLVAVTTTISEAAIYTPRVQAQRSVA